MLNIKTIIQIKSFSDRVKWCKTVRCTRVCSRKMCKSARIFAITTSKISGILVLTNRWRDNRRRRCFSKFVSRSPENRRRRREGTAFSRKRHFREYKKAMLRKDTDNCETNQLLNSHAMSATASTSSCQNNRYFTISDVICITKQ